MIKVSIIAPVYGVEQYVEAFARSVLEQQYEDIEFIFVNDRTKDRSMDIVREVCGQYPNRDVRFVDMECNSGIGMVRNQGLKYATGDYVLFVDSDDILEVGSVEDYVEATKGGTIDVVVSDYTEVDEHYNVLQYVHGSVEPVGVCHHMVERWRLGAVVAWNKFVRRSFLEFRGVTFEMERLYEDTLWSLTVFCFADSVARLERSTILYVQRANSIIHSSIELRHLQALEVLLSKTDSLLFVKTNLGELYPRVTAQVDTKRVMALRYIFELGLSKKQQQESLKWIIPARRAVKLERGKLPLYGRMLSYVFLLPRFCAWLYLNSINKLYRFKKTK